MILTWRALFGTTNGRGDVLQIPVPQVPDPESLPPLHHRPAGAGEVADGITWPPGADWRNGSRPFDIRYVDSPKGPSGARCFWFRTEAVDSSRQNIQRGILAFASDRSLAAAISHARGDFSRGIVRNVASLDQALWFTETCTPGNDSSTCNPAPSVPMTSGSRRAPSMATTAG